MDKLRKTITDTIMISALFLIALLISTAVVLFKTLEWFYSAVLEKH